MLLPHWDIWPHLSVSFLLFVCPFSHPILVNMSSPEEKGSGDLERHGSGQLFDSGGVSTDNDDDPNFDPTAIMMEDESPYPEVRSAVANTDDPTMPVSTLRAWVLGIIWTILLSGTNQFFFFRYPTVYVSTLIPLLVSFPMGKLWASYVPTVTLFGVKLNPGPFTIKEHVLITVMSSVADSAAYATNIIAIQKVLYKQSPSFAYQWLLVMSTQMIGFSFGGICKRFLVDPSSMIWPVSLVFVALFNTMHSLETSGTRGLGGISRRRFFTYVFIVYFFYNFLPSYLFTALSSFSWVCWIAPNNVKLNQMFGVTHGLAMSVLTFDWGQITAFNGSPLPTPWWAAANTGIAIVFFFWFLVPILYYTNTWYSAFLPMVSSQPFDNTGSPPLFISVTFAIFYGLSFASVTSTLTHTLIYHRKQIWNRALRQPDIHTRLMSVYKEVPNWWYLTIFFIMFGFGVATIEISHTKLPIWAFILALIICASLNTPCKFYTRLTYDEPVIGLNVITELIIGYLLPGRPIAVMMFKTWGYYTMFQALSFTNEFKLGHYMKIPPRPMFSCQVVATMIAGTVQLGVQNWIFSNVEDILGCHWPAASLFHGQLYYGLVFFFLLGAVLPIIQIGLMRYLHFPVIFSSMTMMPPATPINYVPWVLVCFLFNYVIRHRDFIWWTKYNFLPSAALDASYVVGTVFIFFALQYPDNGNIGLNSIQNWWGNTVFLNMADAKGTPLKTLSDGQTFGPKTW
ncbi:OPT oligopeptide transporter protein-domain-containing protein [Lactarius quietus]|nr:OPT oligopeptide transporter protein-domain-containing protein [Lactarius quietus]